MLLVVDVGNTNIVLGAYDGPTLVEHWRISTVSRTTDEMGLLFLQLLQHDGIDPKAVQGAIISCVVPSVLYTIEKACRRYLKLDAMVVGRGLKTGMRVRTDNPREVGADRIVNAVAALEEHAPPLVVVDFGTATTFDCVSPEGDYVGGAIAPGLRISADALFERTAMLPRVELERPPKAIGTNTIRSMQSGLIFGYAGLVDGLARRCKDEIGGKPKCVATGGLANLISRSCTEIDLVDDFLTLKGLRLLWERNRAAPR